MTPLLEVRDLTKRYTPDGPEAVSELSFDVLAGEIFALLGPSGCGKTTVLRLVAGLETLDRGTVTIHGRRLAGDGQHLPPDARGVGFVFQEFALFPHLNVEENVEFGLDRLPALR